jgi:hypothetical protein
VHGSPDRALGEAQKAHRDWQAPEDTFGLPGGSLKRRGTVDHHRNARSLAELEPARLRHGVPERCDRDHDSYLVKIGSSSQSFRIELQGLRIDVGDP